MGGGSSRTPLRPGGLKPGVLLHYIVPFQGQNWRVVGWDAATATYTIIQPFITPAGRAADFQVTREALEDELYRAGYGDSDDPNGLRDERWLDATVRG